MVDMMMMLGATVLITITAPVMWVGVAVTGFAFLGMIGAKLSAAAGVVLWTFWGGVASYSWWSNHMDRIWG